VQVSRRGHPQEPDTPDSVAAKFRDNAGRVLPPQTVEKLYAAAMAVDTHSDIAPLMALTVPVGAG
jgi:hypothetical protein